VVVSFGRVGRHFGSDFRVFQKCLIDYWYKIINYIPLWGLWDGYQNKQREARQIARSVGMQVKRLREREVGRGEGGGGGGERERERKKNKGRAITAWQHCVPHPAEANNGLHSDCFHLTFLYTGICVLLSCLVL
jgi:hypothetical protein